MSMAQKATNVFIELRNWMTGRRASCDYLDCEIELTFVGKDAAIYADLGGVCPCRVELWCSCEDGSDVLSFDSCRQRLHDFIEPLAMLLLDDDTETSFRLPDDLSFGASKN